MLTVHFGRAVMTGVAVESVFSVVEAGPDGGWPAVGALGTGCRPTAVPLEHGRSLVVLGMPGGLGRRLPSVSLRGRAMHARAEVSATPR
jgi:hypothetical protein